MRKHLSILTLVALAAAGCGRRPHYVAQGLVLKVDAREGSMTISHDPIPGFMDAMVMRFPLALPAEAAGVRAGDRIRFRLQAGGDRTVIDRIERLSAAPPDAAGIAAASRTPAVAAGAEVPDFSLVDQRGEAVALHAVRGRVVVIGFIYTRCPLPDYCPRVMTNMTALRDRFEGRLGGDLILLTVTFDPGHDTTTRLHEYGERYGANVPGWHLLTGSAADIERVAGMFGVEFYPDEGMIAHSLQSVVVDRQGRLAAIAEGRAFSTRQLGDLVDEILKR